jgi:hypothetical protein
MLESIPASTPLNKGMTKQDSYDDGLPDTPEDLRNRKLFQGLLGSLIWIIKVRKDMQFCVGFFSRMTRYAKAMHLGWLRGQPLRYLNGTRDYGLVYQAGASFETNGASDADFAGDSVSQRSTIGGYGKKGEYGLIWDCCTLVRQVQTSTGHSETTACAAWCREAKASRVQQREYGLVEEGKVKCLVDNAGVVKQAINTTNHAQAKHYRVSQAYIREMCDEEEVLLVQVPTAENPADFFTKALDKGPFMTHRLTIMGPQRNPSMLPEEDDARFANDIKEAKRLSKDVARDDNIKVLWAQAAALEEANLARTVVWDPPAKWESSLEHDEDRDTRSSSSTGAGLEEPWETVKARRRGKPDGASREAQAERKARLSSAAALAHNVELNRQCVSQTYGRLEMRGLARPVRDYGTEPSSGALFRGPGKRGPRHV